MVYPTLCDTCFWLPWFPLLSLPTAHIPHPRNPDQWVGHRLEPAAQSNQANRTL